MPLSEKEEVEKANQIIEQSGLSRRSVAGKCGVIYSYFSEWLHGKRNLDINERIRIMNYLEQAVPLMKPYSVSEVI